ncbi:DUF1347 family protein [Candidatus Chlamydia sanziniae]|uniref:Uncharacterized protein n=1 Tax=Candidatus Chlamydia sanziniae TaxID=1806891 RepID=A0A1A9HWZ0_9CHLA|nr:DUF1347 family protein [Candidatus Chlamydia sanziniae]ANH78554.1 hypothetical protein Cs308_0383 [Candidatus Chlamydia sanziniae]
MLRYVLFCVFLFTCFATGSGLYYLFSSFTSLTKKLKTETFHTLWEEGLKEIPEGTLHCPSAEQQRAHLLCFQGFLLQKQQNFSQADKIFTKAYDEAEKTPFVFKEELLGGSIFNYFFLDKLNCMETFLSRLEEHCPNSPYLCLFKALLSYKQQEFEKTIEFLSCWQREKSRAQAPWLNLNIQQLLGDFFFDQVMAHSLVETDMFPEGRIILNRIIDKLLKRDCEWNTKIYDRTALLLSQSYFLELMQSQSIHIYADYHKMVLFYLKKVHLIEQNLYKQLFPEEKFISMLMTHALTLPIEELSPIIQLLEIWQRHYLHPTCSLVIQPLVENFSKRQDKAAQFCEALVSCSGLEELQQKLVVTFETLLSDKVQQVETLEAKQCVSLLRILDPQISISEKLTLSQETLQKIVLYDDDEQLMKLQNYLALWEAIQSYDIDRQQLVYRLVHSAKQLWKQGGVDQKALKLLQLVLDFTSYDIECENIVFLFVKQVYKQALACHAISRLLHLENFITATGIPSVLISEAEIANFLEDADYLFNHGDYNKCYFYTLWLTKIAPSSHTYRLLGLCLVENKCYEEAWRYFQLLSPNNSVYDSKIQKALALCQKHLPKDLQVNKR